MAQAQQLILSYHDALIYKSDLALLLSPSAWLNDACINFFFQWMKNRLALGHAIRFLDPSVVYYFAHQCTEEDELEDFVACMRFPEGGKIFIPINDGMLDFRNDNNVGGSHWSLLLVSTDQGLSHFWHFDSCQNSGNINVANFISQKLGKHIFRKSYVNCVAAKTPQQSNGFDCGLHMLAAVRLFSLMEESDLGHYETMLCQYTSSNPDFCNQLRKDIADEILRQRNQY